MGKLTCGKCPASSPLDEDWRWCDASRAYFPPEFECKYPSTEHMAHARDWYADLARRLTEAIAMREAEDNAVR